MKKVAAWRRLGIAAIFLTALSGCGPLGVVKDQVIKAEQADSASTYEKHIRERFRANPELFKVKVSVAISNDMLNLYRTKYSVVLAGEIPSQAARDTALTLVRETLEADPSAVLITDHMKQGPAP